MLQLWSMSADSQGILRELLHTIQHGQYSCTHTHTHTHTGVHMYTMVTVGLYQAFLWPGREANQIPALC